MELKIILDKLIKEYYEFNNNYETKLLVLENPQSINQKAILETKEFLKQNHHVNIFLVFLLGFLISSIISLNLVLKNIIVVVITIIISLLGLGSIPLKKYFLAKKEIKNILINNNLEEVKKALENTKEKENKLNSLLEEKSKLRAELKEKRDSHYNTYKTLTDMYNLDNPLEEKREDELTLRRTKC